MHLQTPPRPLVRLPSLDLVKGFVAVGRRMSITQAADDLCLTQSAISKQVRALEDVLGFPLFHRGFRRVTFTEQGELLFRVADKAIGQLQDILALVAAPRRRPVTVTTSTSVAALWLLPRLGEFLGAHPDVDVRFAASNAVLDLGEDVQLAIRYCAGKQAPPGARRLFGESIAPVASPALGLRSLDTPDAFRGVTLLEFDSPGRPWLHWSEWLAARGWTTECAQAVVRFNQYELMIQAALDGQGLALGRLELLQAPLQDGRLVVVDTADAGAPESGYAFWLIQAEHQSRPEVQCFADWICASAARVAQGESHEPVASAQAAGFM
jgi:DNA-binding transcriptional LysR family regulator